MIITLISTPVAKRRVPVSPWTHHTLQELLVKVWQFPQIKFLMSPNRANIKSISFVFTHQTGSLCVCLRQLFLLCQIDHTCQSSGEHWLTADFYLKTETSFSLSNAHFCQQSNSEGFKILWGWIEKSEAEDDHPDVSDNMKEFLLQNIIFKHTNVAGPHWDVLMTSFFYLEFCRN